MFRSLVQTKLSCYSIAVNNETAFSLPDWLETLHPTSVNNSTANAFIGPSVSRAIAWSIRGGTKQTRLFKLSNIPVYFAPPCINGAQSDVFDWFPRGGRFGNNGCRGVGHANV